MDIVCDLMKELESVDRGQADKVVEELSCFEQEYNKTVFKIEEIVKNSQTKIKPLKQQLLLRDCWCVNSSI